MITKNNLEMVIILNLEDEAEPSNYWVTLNQNIQALRASKIQEMVAVNHPNESKEDPNRGKAIAKALGCYPYA